MAWGTKTKFITIGIIATAAVGGFLYMRFGENPIDADEEPVPSPVAVTSHDIYALPNDTSALDGYNLLIADRGNNRLIEITPDKKIIWEYDFNLPSAGLGADDSFFTDNGRTIIVNLELYHVVQQIDYASRKVVWSYGVPGVPGSADGYLNRPDDAYKLPNGDVITTDIKNCRVIEISPDKKIVHQYGVTGVCKNQAGYLDSPNGDTPLPNGHILISNIRDGDIIELDQNWQEVMDLKTPLSYPSDPQLTQAGNILVANYTNPGRIIEISRGGTIVWDYNVQSGSGRLHSPSLAIELPNGNILATDDLNHRVIIIDKRTKQIIWQYGVTGKPGRGPDQLSVPDGLDIIKPSAQSGSTSVPQTVYPIGQLTHHPQEYLNQTVTIQGYPLANEGSYVIFSDESSGALTATDLPVTGFNVSDAKPKQKYQLTGTLVSGGLDAINKNPYHFELTAQIQP